ncbi:MAG: phosphatidylglycerophosphatase A [Candidatus Latescibacteria bacterium]|nr:phosphatidylglycerophosphatase A [Candidatus Latescibacterota bacterium]MDP7448001.1 phosphatidylglycerophosphatase A [Candidatus Latescibacterota bacterium]
MRTAVATVLFSGRAPIAPGTAGSAVTAVAWFVFGSTLTPLTWILLLASVTGIAVVTAGAEARALGREDPGPVVIDEAAGFLFTVAFLPHGLWTTLAAFVLFRILDILKPPPARQLEALHGGWGIVLDDVAAGIMGNLMLHVGLALL